MNLYNDREIAELKLNPFSEYGEFEPYLVDGEMKQAVFYRLYSRPEQDPYLLFQDGTIRQALYEDGQWLAGNLVIDNQVSAEIKKMADTAEAKRSYNNVILGARKRIATDLSGGNSYLQQILFMNLSSKNWFSEPKPLEVRGIKFYPVFNDALNETMIYFGVSDGEVFRIDVVAIDGGDEGVLYEQKWIGKLEQPEQTLATFSTKVQILNRIKN